MDIKEAVIRYKTVVLNILLVLIALFIVSKINAKQIKNIAAIKQEIELELNKSSLLGNISEAEKRLSHYNKLLIRRDASSMMATLSNLAMESRVAVAFIKPAHEQKYEDYVRLPFDLALRAPDYHALGTFIAKLESHSNVFIIENIDIKIITPQNNLEVRLKVDYIISEVNR
ncbi:MAG: type 4a pilus biogenesis protein PilO [Candidatus Omnitrophota bacterium]